MGIIVFFVKVLLPEIIGLALLIWFLFAAGDLSIIRRLVCVFFVVTIYLGIRVVDPYLGKVHTQKLCDENSSFEIYKTVTVPGTYWNDDGSPVFGRRSTFEIDAIEYEKTLKSELINSHFAIKANTRALVVSSNGEILGESVGYSLLTTWYQRFIGLSSRVTYRCGGYPPKNDDNNAGPWSPAYMNSIEMWVFQPAKEVDSK